MARLVNWRVSWTIGMFVWEEKLMENLLALLSSIMISIEEGSWIWEASNKSVYGV